MFKTNALDNVANRYVDENPGAGIVGTRLEADDRNIIQDELINAVERSAQTPDPSGTFTHNYQVAMAMLINAISAQWFVDGGAADDYELTPATGASGLVVPASYDQLHGALVNFTPGNANTGASTVDIGQSAATLIGPKKLLDIGGNDLVGGELLPNHIYEIRYDSAADTGTGAWILIGEKSFPVRVNVVAFGSSGSYDAAAAKAAGLKFILVIARGAGGGGGGVDGQGANTYTAGGGGASGAEAIGIILATALGASETVTIGAGGAGGTGAGGGNGADGGHTYFGAFLTAQGGEGGDGDVAANTFSCREGGRGYNASGGDVNKDGYPGGKGVAGGAASGRVVSGQGGGPGAGWSVVGQGAGIDAICQGAGGSGASVHTVTTNYGGGDGANGVIYIFEIY